MPSTKSFSIPIPGHNKNHRKANGSRAFYSQSIEPLDAACKNHKTLRGRCWRTFCSSADRSGIEPRSSLMSQRRSNPQKTMAKLDFLESGGFQKLKVPWLK